jgi:hypothetical protein
MRQLRLKVLKVTKRLTEKELSEMHQQVPK